VDVTPVPDAEIDVKYCDVQLEVNDGGVPVAHWPKAWAAQNTSNPVTKIIVLIFIDFIKWCGGLIFCGSPVATVKNIMCRGRMGKGKMQLLPIPLRYIICMLAQG
jgi:hypothetical protein